MNRRAVAMLAVLTAVAGGCGTEDDSRPLTLPPGAVYRSPLGNFTCVAPNLLEGHGHQAERRAGDDSVTVTVADDYGTLLQIESGKTDPADRAALAGPGRRASLDAFFDRVFLPGQIIATFPQARVIRREFIRTSAGDALFAVAQLPDGICRGYTLFPEGAYLYAVTNQEWPSMVRDVDMPMSDRVFRLQSGLRQAIASMTFAD